jgi:hypothetical protein
MFTKETQALSLCQYMVMLPYHYKNVYILCRYSFNFQWTFELSIWMMYVIFGKK